MATSYAGESRPASAASASATGAGNASGASRWSDPAVTAASWSAPRTSWANAAGVAPDRRSALGGPGRECPARVVEPPLLDRLASSRALTAPTGLPQLSGGASCEALAVALSRADEPCRCLSGAPLHEPCEPDAAGGHRHPNELLLARIAIRRESRLAVLVSRHLGSCVRVPVHRETLQGYHHKSRVW